MCGEAVDRSLARMTTSTTSLGRLGAWAADHRRLVVVIWAAALLVLGALAPFADRALSGAGWEAPASESGEARRAIESHFPGQGTYALSVVVAGERAGIEDRPMRAAVANVRSVLLSDRAVSGVKAPEPGVTVSRDGRTAIVTGLAGAPPSEMVDAAGRVKDRLARLSGRGVTVRLTGAAAMWSDFNHANKAAMMRSEALSWPLTLTLLVLAFGTLTAAGLPLVLTMAGLVSAGGLLFLSGQLFDVSIWAMNFAMMFAIALGIDYALFLVVRFRGALAAGLSSRDATVHTMATAGKAVLASGLTVIAALLAVMLVPVPTFRSVPLGIVLAVLSVLAATLTLLPAALSALGHRINGGRIRLRKRGRPSQRAVRRVGPPPVGATAALRRRRVSDPGASRRAGAGTADRDADNRGRPTRCRLTRGSRAREAGVRGGCAEPAPGGGGRARPRPRHGRPEAGSENRGRHAPAARGWPRATHRRAHVR